MPNRVPEPRPALGHAAVIGASMAGLTATRVLADHFERVTLIERDELADTPEPRKGVPQGRHLHALLQRGENILEALFPDLLPALIDGGAVPVDFGTEFAWHHFGVWKAPTQSGVVTSIMLSRPYLEQEVRRRVVALPNVTVMDGGDVHGLVASADRRRVTGVVLRRRGQEEETLATDLLVDASGRGSRMPAWLEQLGRSPVKETTVQVDVGYATRLFRRPALSPHPWKALYVLGQFPDSKRNGALFPIEGQRWISVMAGLLGDHPPADAAGWLEFARGLPVPDLYHVLKDAEPVSDIAVYKFPAHRRRHYERMRDFPDGLVILGDAHLSFNPMYGQGMTTAAIGSMLLNDELERARQRSTPLPEGFSQRYQRALARLSSDPWAMSTGEDLRYPEVVGERPFGNAALQWYTRRLHQVAASDPEITLSFYRAMHLVSPLSELMRPKAIWKVLKGPSASAPRVSSFPRPASHVAHVSEVEAPAPTTRAAR